MSSSEFREITAFGFIPLAVNELLTPDQLSDGIEIYEAFDSMSFTNAERRKWERKAAKQIKRILLREG